MNSRLEFFLSEVLNLLIHSVDNYAALKLMKFPANYILIKQILLFIDGLYFNLRYMISMFYYKYRDLT